MPRLAKARGIKKNWTYTVAEAAGALGVSRNTIHIWIGKGLPTVSDGKPFLIRGDDLKRFLDECARKRKQPSGPGKLRCMTCSAAKRPVDGAVDYIPQSAQGGTRVGVCPDCRRFMHRFASRTSLDEAASGLSVTIKGQGATLERAANLPANRGFNEDINP